MEEMYFVELISYEHNSKVIKDSHDIMYFENKEDAEKYFNEEVSRNEDNNYGYILGLVDVEFNEDGTTVASDLLDIFEEC